MLDFVGKFSFFEKVEIVAVCVRYSLVYGAKISV